tara:strand:- start:532 stop:660 length:129 start_codon:yes stop_codon:yes gene_type:complete
MNKNKTIYITKYFINEGAYFLFGRKLGLMVWGGLIYSLSFIA